MSENQQVVLLIGANLFLVFVVVLLAVVLYNNSFAASKAFDTFIRTVNELTRQVNQLQRWNDNKFHSSFKEPADDSTTEVLYHVLRVVPFIERPFDVFYPFEVGRPELSDSKATIEQTMQHYKDDVDQVIHFDLGNSTVKLMLSDIYKMEYLIQRNGIRTPQYWVVRRKEN